MKQGDKYILVHGHCHNCPCEGLVVTIGSPTEWLKDHYDVFVTFDRGKNCINMDGCYQNIVDLEPWTTHI